MRWRSPCQNFSRSGGPDQLDQNDICKDSASFHVDPKGRNGSSSGVREFGMMAMVNGIAAHGGPDPVRLYLLRLLRLLPQCCCASGALMSVHSLYIFTHDSVGLGEDGPTRSAD